MADKRPIGVFDSGLGGLTSVKELRAILPGEDIVYFGDTGRVPYGSKGRETIIAYARQDLRFLLSKNVKAILVACGTVSSTMPQSEIAALPVRCAGVVQATAKAAAKATKNGKVAILGTEATIASGSFQRAMAGFAGIETVAKACPLFVPLVENGHFGDDDEMATLAAKEYLGEVRAAGVDTVVLGCTHYPLLAGVLGRYFGPGVTLIDSGREAALALRGALAKDGLLAEEGKAGHVSYYVSDDPERFESLAKVFLGQGEVGRAQRVAIEEYA